MQRIEEFKNRIICGNCIDVMRDMPDESVDLVVTDPPYLVNYRDRDGRAIKGDDVRENRWLEPAFFEIYRVLKKDSFCVSFYGFTQAEKFLNTWKSLGFRVLEHFVFTKSYASSVGFAERCHESAYLLAKGRPAYPASPPPSVLKWHYTGNEFHPTQKPQEAILPLIRAYSKTGEVVLDPFAGSATTAVCAERLKRAYVAIELDWRYYGIARRRLGK